MKVLAVFIWLSAIFCADAKATLDFTGCIEIGSHLQVAISDSESRRTRWAAVGEEVFAYRVVGLDRRTDVVTLEHRSGHVLRLPLKTAKVVSGGVAGYALVGKIDARRVIRYSSFHDLMKDYSHWSGRRVVVSPELPWDARIGIGNFDLAPERAAKLVEEFMQSAGFEFAPQPDGSAALRERR